jgi:hypothetical protein
MKKFVRSSEGGAWEAEYEQYEGLVSGLAEPA